MSTAERHLKVIVFSDVVDSSAQIFADELIAIQRIKEDLAMIRTTVQRHGGSLVKSLGDGILATFAAPTQALEFVEDVVIRIARRGHQSLQHRFGLHTGEIYVNGDDIIGQGVHLASRLQTIAPANGVAFVQSTYEMIDPGFQRRAVLLGPLTLKGLPGPITCYAIESEALLGAQAGAALEPLGLEALLADTPYRLERPLGGGPRPSTFLVREASRDRRAVLKLIACEASNLEALRVEAACLDRLRHPRLPRFVDAFEHRGTFLFLQEYIAGASLQGSLDYLRRKQRLAELLRQVLEVLQAVHAAGIVHGDLHPANLIPPQEGGPVFLVDFGLLKAQASAGSLPRSAAGAEGLLGRPFFSPPERARFGSLTPAGDLYALGVSALVLYTGRTPQDLYDQAQGCWRLEDLDPEVLDWLAPLLEESPARRLQSAADALQRLDRPWPPAGAAPAPGAGPASPRLEPLVAPPGPLRKAVLLRTLAETYGPVVELLLESCPSLLPREAVEPLRQRLVGAGLARADVDQACRAAVNPAPAEPAESAPLAAAASPPAAVPSSVAPAAPAAGVAGDQALLEILRRCIGPIADLLWTDELRLALGRDASEARGLLLASAVPLDAVEEFLSLARATLPRGGAAFSPAAEAPPPVPPSAPLPAAPPPVAPQDPSPEAPPFDEPTLREVVLSTLGPIGQTLLEAHVDLPLGQRWQALLAELQTYGVEPEVVAELRRRLQMH